MILKCTTMAEISMMHVHMTESRAKKLPLDAQNDYRCYMKMLNYNHLLFTVIPISCGDKPHDKRVHRLRLLPRKSTLDFSRRRITSFGIT